MSDRVILVGLRRGGTLVPASEIKQMIGRAGRSHNSTGLVQIIVEERDEGIVNELCEGENIIVESSMSDVDLLASSILPEICNGEIKNFSDAQGWCSRSFCLRPPIEKAIVLLKEVEAITEIQNSYIATELGKCASCFYFHPADVFAWKNNFTMLFDMEIEHEEASAAWALGNIPYDRIIGDLGDNKGIAPECRNKLSFGLDVMKGSMINVVSWWYLMGGPPIGSLRFACLERRRNYGRVNSALNWLDTKCAGWNKAEYFSDLELRVMKGVIPELLPLCRLKGISKGRAEYLYSLGVKTRKDLAGVLNKIRDEIDVDFAQTIESLTR
jgi:replicative superfamily II helicase